MTVFAHHLYEYKKGLRRLILHTTRTEYEDIIVQKLMRRGIAHIIHRVSEKKINVFFGANYCIEVLRTFPSLELSSLSPDKDFILGAMLGYDMKLHCKRYLRSLAENRASLEREAVEI
jgi:hypothetical protein